MGFNLAFEWLRINTMCRELTKVTKCDSITHSQIERVTCIEVAKQHLVILSTSIIVYVLSSFAQYPI